MEPDINNASSDYGIGSFTQGLGGILGSVGNLATAFGGTNAEKKIQAPSAPAPNPGATSKTLLIAGGIGLALVAVILIAKK